MGLVAIDQSHLYANVGGGKWWACKCTLCGEWASKFDETREQTLEFGREHRCHDGPAGEFRVDVPPRGDKEGFVALFAVHRSGKIVEAAPVMGRWVGQSVDAFARWARGLGGTFTRIA